MRYDLNSRIRMYLINYVIFGRGLMAIITKPSLGMAHIRSTARKLESKQHRKHDYAPHLKLVQDAISIVMGIDPESPYLVRENSPLKSLRDVIIGRRLASKKSPIPQTSDGSWILAEILYMVCRILQPSVVVETGVGFGVTSTYILQALKDNGIGTLHSVEFADLWWGYSKSVGLAVPKYLRSNWNLYFGPSEVILPRLLKSIDHVDIFVHDSSHTYRDQLIEYSMIWPYLRPGGLLISDDVDGCDAFYEFAEGKGRFAVVSQDAKRRLIGLLRKRTNEGY